MRDNTEKKMAKLGITGDTKKKMIKDIFGGIVEDLKVKGLIDCWDCLELDRMFCVIADEWKKMTEKGEAFVAYFEQHKLPLIANCMTAKLHTAAGLGYPPDCIRRMLMSV